MKRQKHPKMALDEVDGQTISSLYGNIVVLVRRAKDVVEECERALPPEDAHTRQALTWLREALMPFSSQAGWPEYDSERDARLGRGGGQGR